MVTQSLSETLAEMLLAGAVGLDEDLDDIADVLSTLKETAMPDPDADFSHLYRAAAKESRLTPLQRYAREHMPRMQDWQTRVALAGAALFVLVSLSGGLAYAANGAKPGDLLYGLDRALEAIGIGDGGGGERLAEAYALAATGVASIGSFHEPSDSPPANDTALEPSAAGSDDLEDDAQESDLLEQPREGNLGDDHDEDAGSVDDEEEPVSTGATGGGRTDEPDPGEDDDPTATADEKSDDATDTTDGPEEDGDDATNNTDNGDASDDSTDTSDSPSEDTNDTTESGSTDDDDDDDDGDDDDGDDDDGDDDDGDDDDGDDDDGDDDDDHDDDDDEADDDGLD